MKAYLPRLEAGISRLYYFGWFVYLVALTNYMYESDSFQGSSEQIRNGILEWLGEGLVIPAFIMFGVRWVYRGFVPKPK